MRKKVLCSLLVSCLLASTPVRASEIIEEEKQEEGKKVGWVRSQYDRATQAVKKVPRWVWWASAVATTSASVISVGWYFHKTGVFEYFLSSKSADPHGEKEKGVDKEEEKKDPYKEIIKILDSIESPVFRITKNLKAIKEAVVDLEKEQYGTSFLEEDPLISIDGKDILLISKEDN